MCMPLKYTKVDEQENKYGHDKHGPEFGSAYGMHYQFSLAKKEAVQPLWDDAALMHNFNS